MLPSSAVARAAKMSGRSRPSSRTSTCRAGIHTSDSGRAVVRAQPPMVVPGEDLRPLKSVLTDGAAILCTTGRRLSAYSGSKKLESSGRRASTAIQPKSSSRRDSLKTSLQMRRGCSAQA